MPDLLDEIINSTEAAAAAPGGADFLDSVINPAPVSYTQAVKKSGALRRVVGDTAVGLARGVAKLPEVVIGLADIPTGGYAGLLAEKAGYDFKAPDKFYNPLLSPETQEAQRKVAEAKGFLPTLKTMVQNPSTVVQAAAESAPSMIGGWGIARKAISAIPTLAKLAPTAAGAIAAGIGEGVITAGQQAEQIRQESADGLLAPKQIALAVGSGVVTGALGVVGGKIANKLGITDIDVWGAGVSQETRKGFFRRIAEGIISEGALEELPQSAQEQMAQNLALNRPIMEGVAEAAAQGFLVGGLMGAGANALPQAQPEVKVDVHKAVTDTLAEKASGSEVDAGEILSAKVEEQVAPVVPEAPLTDQFGDEILADPLAGRVSQFQEESSDPWAVKPSAPTPEAAIQSEALAYLGDIIPAQEKPLVTGPTENGQLVVPQVLNPETLPPAAAAPAEQLLETPLRPTLAVANDNIGVETPKAGVSWGQFRTKQELYRKAIEQTGSPEGAKAWMTKYYTPEVADALATGQDVVVPQEAVTPAAPATEAVPVVPPNVTRSHYLKASQEAQASILTEGLPAAEQKLRDMQARVQEVDGDSVVTKREQSVLKAWEDTLRRNGVETVQPEVPAAPAPEVYAGEQPVPGGPVYSDTAPVPPAVAPAIATGAPAPGTAPVVVPGAPPVNPPEIITKSQYSVKSTDDKTLTPETVDKLTLAMARILPGGKATIYVTDKITAADPTAFKAHGLTAGEVVGLHQSTLNITTGELKSVISLAYNGATEATGYHELLHASEALGIISPKDMTILEAAYPDTEGKASSELRADAFGQYSVDRNAVKPLVRRVFDKIRDFIAKVKNALDGLGYRSAEDVFADLYSGKMKGNAGEGRYSGDQMAAAWHGSPHDFDKFKSSQIGTGEGAQAYGHGLYFAGSNDVAEYYKKTLSRDRLKGDLEVLQAGAEVKDSIEAAGYLGLDTLNRALAAIRNDTQWAENNLLSLKEAKRIQNALDNYSALTHNRKGKLYEVELAPKESEYLLWDKPLSAQSETVKEALAPVVDFWAYRDGAPEDARENMMSTMRGERLYNASEIWQAIDEAGAMSFDGDKSVSEYLHSLGIRGIKYLDGSSRSKGEGNYNYVIFSDDDVSITNKYSVLPPKESLNAMGARSMPFIRATGSLLQKGIQILAPLDRAINLYSSQPWAAPFHPFLARYKNIKLMSDYIQNTLLTKAHTLYDGTLEAAGFSGMFSKNAPDAQKNIETFHQVVNHGTLAQIFPDRPLNEQPWETKLFGDLDGEAIHAVKRTDPETKAVTYEARYFDDREALATGATLEEALAAGEVAEVFTKKKAGKRTTVELVDGTRVEALKTAEGFRVLKKQTPPATTGKVADVPVKAVRLKDGTWEIRRVVSKEALGVGATKEEALKNAGSEEITARHEWDVKNMPERTGYKTLTEAHDVLSRAYKSMPEALQQHYQEKQKQIKEFTDIYVKALRDRIINSTETGEAQDALLARLDRQFKMKGPYSPLMRYGDYVLNVYDKQGGNRIARYQYDTTVARAKAERELLAETPGLWTEKSTRAQWSRAESNIPASFIDKMTEIIRASGANQEAAEGILADMEQLWFAHAPETSAMKHSMRRTGLAGFDTDSLRAHLSYVNKIARATSTLVYGGQQKDVLDGMQEVVNGITKEGGDPTKLEGLMQYLKTQDNAVRDERISPVIRKLSAIPFVWYLTSPSTFIVQSTQPFAFSYPYLAARGYGAMKSFTAIVQGYKNQVDGKFTSETLNKYVFKDGASLTDKAERLIAADAAEAKSLTAGMSDEELKLLAMKKGELDGTFNISQTHEALDVIVSGQRSKWNKALDRASFFMRVSELASRKSVFAAAFDLEFDKTKNFEGSMNFAREAVAETLFNYNQSNRPIALTGWAGRLFGQFRTYQLNGLFKLVQLTHDSFVGMTPEEKTTARKELAFMVGSVGTMAGSLGLPFAPAAFAALNFLFGDEDDPFDVEEVYAQAMREMLGDTAGNVALKGLPALLGADMSRRVGMQGMFNVFNSEQPEKLYGADLFNWYVGQATGPAGGVAAGMFKAEQAYKKGDWYGAFKASLPKAMGDLVKAVQIADEGQVSGARTIQGPENFSMYDWALAAAGLNPMQMSLASEEHGVTVQASARIAARKQELSGDLARAIADSDADGRDAAIEDIIRFNKKAPAFAFKSSDLAQAVKREMMARRGITPKREQKIKVMMEGRGGTPSTP